MRREEVTFHQAPASDARSELSPDYVAPLKSNNTAHLNTVLRIYSAIEFFAVACSTYIGSIVYHYITFNSWQTGSRYTVAAILIASLVLSTSVGFHNFFSFRRQPRHVFLFRGLGAVALSFSTFLTILFFTQSAEAYSRGSLFFQIISVSIAVISARTLFYSWLQNATTSNRIEARRAALIGDVFHCSTFANRLKLSGIKTVGVFQLPANRDTKTKTVISRETISRIRAHRVDDVIILAKNEIMFTVFDLASSLAELPASIHIVPVDAPSALASSQITEFGDLRTLQIYRPPLSAFDLFIKRAFDLAGATIGLIVLSPLFLVISIAIKIDFRGSALFRQTRHGFNNDEIRVFKFRSMTTMEDGVQVTPAVENDPRVTRIGRIIRRTNIDELPQIINVLRGEMSLVGPRPHAAAHNALFNELIPPFSRRHNVKPGITGWSQVNGHRGSINTLEKLQRRIEYDLYYIDNWSFLFDLKILMMTLFSKTAYLNAH